MNYYGKTDKGKNMEMNEDYLDGFQKDGVMFLMVADGQGSFRSGLTASAIAIHEIRKYIEEVFQRGMEKQLETILRRAFYVAHRVIEGVRMGNPERYNGLCTSLTAVALQKDKTVTFAHAGNTKLYLFRDQELLQMTKDHTVAQRLFEEKKITKEEIKMHPERAFLTQGLGIFDSCLPQVQSGTLSQGDILLLTSDGIPEHLTQEEMAEIILLSGNIKDTSENLVEAANERGGYDNLTVITSYINF